MTETTETRRRREGTYRCAKCGTRHQRAGQHEDGTFVTPSDRPEVTYAILTYFAGLGGHGHMAWRSLAATVCADVLAGDRIDHRTRAGRAFTEAFLEACFLQVDLVDAGLLDVVEEPTADGEHPWGYAITAQGRARLAELGGP